MDGRQLAIAALFLLCLSTNAPSSVEGAVMAIDLGGEFLKISILKPGRIPISIVTNEMSKRKTPAAVAFVGEDRLVGEEAAALSVRHPDRVVTRLRDLLGRRYDESDLKKTMEGSHLPFDIVQADNRTAPAVAVQMDAGQMYAAEELVASLLEYAQKLAEAEADGDVVRDCVLVVPAYFSLLQRQALLDAASLAGLNVLSLVHSHTAAALQYGIERDFGNSSQLVLFYDLGYSSAEVSLIRFSSYGGDKPDTMSLTPQLEVLDVAWVQHGTAGDALEDLLLDHFASQHSDPTAVLENKKAVAKLRKQVKRTKEILSANTEAPLSVEELLPGVDFKSTISREEFEAIAERAGVWQRATAPVIEILKRNNLTAADLASVELLGGSSRIPKVKSALSEALGGRALDMHLDADEAVVMGAGLVAANLSTIFRLRKFGMVDKTPYEITFSIDGIPTDSDDSNGNDKNNDPSRKHVLVPALKKMPSKRSIAHYNLTVDSFAAHLASDNSIGAVASENARQISLGSISVSGIEDVVAQHGFSGKITIHTSINSGGVFQVDKADAAVDIEEEVEVPIKQFDGPSAASSNSSTNVTESNAMDVAPQNASETFPHKTSIDASEAVVVDGTSSESSTKPELESESAPVETKVVRRTVRIPLQLEKHFLFPGMNDTELSASRKVLRVLKNRERAKREAAKARNDMESYIIEMRGSLRENDELIAVSTEEQREAAIAALDDGEDWLYGDGETASASGLREKLREVRKLSDAIEDRAFEASARRREIPSALAFVELSLKTARAWSTTKPWLNETEVREKVEELEETKSWIEERMDAQSKLKDHEEPVFQVGEVLKRVESVRKSFNRLNNRPKPIEKPPPPPANADDPNRGESSTSDSEGRDASVDGSEEGASDSDSASQQEREEDGSDTAHDEL